MAAFSDALEAGDIAAVLDGFLDECYWRDLLSFTWNVKTLEGKDDIAAMLRATLANARPGAWAIEGAAPCEALWGRGPRFGGYVGGSSAERLPVEEAVPAAARAFKSVALKK